MITRGVLYFSCVAMEGGLITFMVVGGLPPFFRVLCAIASASSGFQRWWPPGTALASTPYFLACSITLASRFSPYGSTASSSHTKASQVKGGGAAAAADGSADDDDDEEEDAPSSPSTPSSSCLTAH
jgi:hypothetical protein